METRDFEEIERALSASGKATLFEYLELEESCSDAEAEAALTRKRAWAQAQQSNPKYRTEAIWFIKNMALVRRAITTERSDYQGQLAQRDQGRKVQILKQFILGVLADGVLNRAKEKAIAEQAQTLGIEPEIAKRALDQMAEQAGIKHESRKEVEAFQDHYSVLGTPPTADYNQLYTAYKERLEQARQTLDRQLAEEQRDRLEYAWRVVSDPAQRVAYDTLWREHRGQEVQKAAAPLPSPSPVTPGPKAPEPVRPNTVPNERKPDQPTERPKLSLAPGPDAAPPPPEALGARAVNPEQIRSPPLGKLKIDPEGTVNLVTDGQPLEWVFTVKRQGDHPLPARVYTQLEWVTVQPTQLNPHAVEQQVTVRIDPTRMGRKQAVALVTVVSDLTNQRLSLTLDVRRKANRTPIYAAVGSVLAVCALGATLWLLREPPPEPPAAARAFIEVDPPNAEIYLDGDLHGIGPRLELPLPADKESRIQVKLDGFQPWIEVVPGAATGSRSLKAHLDLLPGEMSWSPQLSEPAGTFAEEGRLNKALAEIQPQAERCIAQHGPNTGTSPTVVPVSLYVKPEGTISSLKFAENAQDKPPLRECLERVIRSVRCSRVDGPYGIIETTWRAQTGAEAAHP